MDIIFITSRFPFPIDKGDKLRAYYQIKELSKVHNVYLLSISEKNLNQNDINKLKEVCSDIHIFKINLFKRILNLFKTFINNKPFQVNYFYSKSIQRNIDNIIKEVQPDHIICQLIRTAMYMKNQHQIPSTIDYMDALSKGIQRRIPIASFWMKPILKMEFERLKKFENLAYEFFENHIIISKSDRNSIAHNKSSKIKIIANGIDTEIFKKYKFKKKYDLVFIGNLNYVPNIDTALYIGNTIVPELRKTYPDIKILIAGSNPSNKVKKLSNENITISGWVEDIKEAYLSGKIFFAPMKIGTGLQNKLLEAMSLEIPCITSPLANKALGAINNNHILIGNNSQEHINHIKYCLENNSAAEHLGANGRVFVKKNFSWNKSNELLLNVLSKTNQ